VSDRALLDEVEAVARIGSYSLDVSTGSWVSSKGLDAIYGIDASFERSVQGWASLVHPAQRDAMVAYFAEEVLGHLRPFDRQYQIVRADTGEERSVHGRGALELDASGRPVRMFGTIADVTETHRAQRALVASELRYAAIFDGAIEAIVVADRASERFRWVNPAACALLGYAPDELLELTITDVHPPADLPGVREQLEAVADGRLPMARSVPYRRKDGGLVLVDVRASWAEVDGLASMIGFLSDVTEIRRLESGLAREFSERAQVAAALSRLQPAATAEATAAEICDELFGLPGIDVASIINFVGPELATPLALRGPDGLPATSGRRLPAARAAYLYERAAQGPWAERFAPRPEDGLYGQLTAQAGLRAMAYAPIRNGEGLLGLIAAGTCDEDYARHLVDRLPAVGEFAATASALLSRALETGHRDQVLRGRVRRALARGGLSPVFQPIVELGSGVRVGYEALTRFADGTPPDRMIADAHSVGLGVELEVACIAAALDASEALAPGPWLSLNASPDAIIHSRRLARLLAGRSRRIVLEVTEHIEIDNYPAVGRAAARFGPTVSLAVDDAGAGFASLRHVVELRPRFLKIDISLVRHVDSDVTRQAMIAGLRHFAGRAGCEVIAEGIEQRVELEMLRELGVTLGQGYLLGRPSAVGATPAASAPLGVLAG
jgi:PAS domain S-box-containing protein